MSNQHLVFLICALGDRLDDWVPSGATVRMMCGLLTSKVEGRSVFLLGEAAAAAAAIAEWLVESTRYFF